MATFPHVYKVRSSGGPDGVLPVESDGLPTLETTAPPEFGGPEGYWSPETLLTGAVANCLILTFRALAAPRNFQWSKLDVSCTGEVNKTREGLRFTAFRIDARLTIGADTDEAQARALLDSAKKYCLITASLNAETELRAEITRA